MEEERRWLGASSLRPRARVGVGGAPSRRPERGLAAGHRGANWLKLGGDRPVPHARDSLFFNQHPPHPPTSCALLKGT